MALTSARQASCGQASVSPQCESKPIQALKRLYHRDAIQRRERRVAAQAAKPRPGSVAALAACISRPNASGLQHFNLNYRTSIPIDDGPTSHFDILGLAQSMVDVTTEESVHDDVLQALGVTKGGRRVLSSVDERSQVLASLEDAGSTTKITPGGSLANTLVAISRLSKASECRTQLNVALGSSCSSDAIGQFFSSQMMQAGVAVLPTGDTSGHTGTVFVLASADAQRSFLSYFHSEEMRVSKQLKRAIANSRLVVVEGYLWELPNAAATIAEVVATARASGAQVALTAGDPGVVARHRDEILKVLEAGGQDMLLFANMEEARQLCGEPVGLEWNACSAAAQLGSICSLAVVTDGPSGSYVSCMGDVQHVPPAHAPLGVVDTCGAGDAYAAGFCFALTMGHDYVTAGSFGSCVAARVIGRHGAQLLEEEAEILVDLLPLHAQPAFKTTASAKLWTVRSLLG